jgi:hypothetical protein
MKYNEYKIKLIKERQENKDYSQINGLWTLLAYIFRYQTKELFGILLIIAVPLIVAMIINPDIAFAIKQFIIHRIK